MNRCVRTSNSHPSESHQDATDIPTTKRTWFVLRGIIVSYVLAAAIVLFNAWAVATILNLL